MKNFLNEFKTFMLRGNALELAIGVVIGAAFGQITNVLSTNILTPPLGLLLGDIDFSKLSIPLGQSSVIGYGLLIQAVLNFILIALALFLVIKLINRIARKQAQEEEKKIEKSPEVLLLEEIRDELRNRSRQM